MTEHYADDWLTIHQGDARAVLATLPAESVHCVVTSPPYWGLRDYGTPGQLGLEATPEEYVVAMVDVFREVRRVLRADGTVWLNLGDSYAPGGGSVGEAPGGGKQGENWKMRGKMTAPNRMPLPGLKPKDLVGIPWRVAFALQADGWYLRSDVIWSKPNPMPESVTDRPTKSHEYLFLLAKSTRYYFDADAVREAFTYPLDATRQFKPDGWATGKGAHNAVAHHASRNGHDDATAIGAASDKAGRNIRSVWTIATAPYPGAHFATFPPRLVEPCIKAGTSERGVCPECGAPWERVTSTAYDAQGRRTNGPRSVANRDITAGYEQRLVKSVETTGWRPTCKHEAEPVPAVVMDPFAGTGAVGMVAQRLSRRAVLIDLNADYLAQCMARNAQTPLGL